ncbi:MAG: hypothetical protein ACP5I8_11430 [Phycisphaerae bacterium]
MKRLWCPWLLVALVADDLPSVTLNTSDAEIGGAKTPGQASDFSNASATVWWLPTCLPSAWV